MAYGKVGSVVAQKSKKKSKQQTMGFAPTPEDLKLVAELKVKYAPTMGVVTTATLLRMGLRSLAEPKNQPI